MAIVSEQVSGLQWMVLVMYRYVKCRAGGLSERASFHVLHWQGVNGI